MNLYSVTWQQWKNHSPVDCWQLVRATNEMRAKWVVTQIQDADVSRKCPFTAKIVTSEAELEKLVKPEQYDNAFVQDERDYTHYDDDNIRGDYLTCKMLGHVPSLLDALRLQWRQEHNEREAIRLNLVMAF